MALGTEKRAARRRPRAVNILSSIKEFLLPRNHHIITVKCWSPHKDTEWKLQDVLMSHLAHEHYWATAMPICEHNLG